MFGKARSPEGAHATARNFITLLGSTMVVGLLTAHAQQSGGMRRIGVLMSYPKRENGSQMHHERNVASGENWYQVDFSNSLYGKSAHQKNTEKKIQFLR